MSIIVFFSEYFLTRIRKLSLATEVALAVMFLSYTIKTYSFLVNVHSFVTTNDYQRILPKVSLNLFPSVEKNEGMIQESFFEKLGQFFCLLNFLHFG